MQKMKIYNRKCPLYILLNCRLVSLYISTVSELMKKKNDVFWFFFQINLFLYRDWPESAFLNYITELQIPNAQL